ncbi:MAG: hypothetical protein Q7T82_11155 [Armatimonadota bacterium]|nr:hypothetical protein [Armatimonadota bacterium]
MTIQDYIRKVKAEERCLGIWRKKSTAKTRESASKYILSYRDEASGATTLDSIGRDEAGYVGVFGFLRDDVERATGKGANQMSNDDRVIACHRAWLTQLHQHTGTRKFVHKYLLTLDPTLEALMGMTGRDSGALLVQGARTVLRYFNEKYYLGDRLGFMVGIRRHRRQTQVQVLLMPWTEGGGQLKVTDSDDDKRSRYLCKVADKFVREYFRREFEAPLRTSDRPVDQVMQKRLLAYTVWKSLPKDTVAETERFAWLAAELTRRENLSDDLLREVLDTWHRKVVGIHANFVRDLASNADKLKHAVGMVGARYAEQKQGLELNEARLHEIKATQTKLMVALNSFQSSLSNFRFFAAGSRGIGLCVHQAPTDAVRKWLTGLCANPLLEYSAPQAEGDRGMVKVVVAMRTSGKLRRVVENGQKDGPAPEADLRFRATSGRELVRHAVLIQVEELRERHEQLKVKRTAARTERDGLLIRMDGIKVLETVVIFAAKGLKPMFLEQYEGLKRAGIDIPVLARRERSQDMVPGHQTERAAEAFEPLNPEISKILHPVKESTPTAVALEVDRYFRAVMDAAAAPWNRRSRREAAETALREKLATKTLQKFLMGQDAATQAEPTVISERVKRINRSPDFDL